MSPRHRDSVSTLLPSSPMKQALNEHRRGYFGLWAVGVIPGEVVLVEKDALLWISPRLVIKTRRGEFVIIYKRGEFSRKYAEILKDEKQ